MTGSDIQQHDVELFQVLGVSNDIDLGDAAGDDVECNRTTYAPAWGPRHTGHATDKLALDPSK